MIKSNIIAAVLILIAWGIGNEYLHATYDYLVGYAQAQWSAYPNDVMVIFTPFETGIFIFGGISWVAACFLLWNAFRKEKRQTVHVTETEEYIKLRTLDE